jgi:hypothetical protein
LIIFNMFDAAALASAYMAYQGQKETNAANAEIAAQQMQFQERMSNTSYQRQVEDLKKAGINPMYGYMRASGASTPPGASYVAQNPAAAGSQAYASAAGARAASAQAAKTEVETEITEEVGLAQARANLEKTVADFGLTTQQTAKVMTDTELSAAQIATERERPAQVRALIDNLVATTQTELFKQLNLEQQTALLRAQVPMYMARAQLDQNQVRAEANTENIRRHVEQLGPVGRFVSGAVNVFKSIFGK